MDDKILMFFYKNIGLKYKRAVAIICNAMPLVMGAIYFISIIKSYKLGINKFARCILAPFFTFVLTGVIRYKIDRKRPFENMDIIPVIRHDKGKSFPSRHTVSAFIIAFSAYKSGVGYWCFIPAALTGISRVIAGVHYLSDVVFGAAFGAIMGILLL